MYHLTAWHRKLSLLKVLIIWTNVKHYFAMALSNEEVTSMRLVASSGDVANGSRLFLAAEIDWAASSCQCIDWPGLHSVFAISSFLKASLIMKWRVCFSHNSSLDRLMVIGTLTSLVREVHRGLIKYIVAFWLADSSKIIRTGGSWSCVFYQNINVKIWKAKYS